MLFIHSAQQEESLEHKQTRRYEDHKAAKQGLRNDGSDVALSQESDGLYSHRLCGHTSDHDEPRRRRSSPVVRAIERRNALGR